jgi:transposase
MSLGRVVLAPPERRELNRRTRKRSLAVEIVKRAEVILMLAAGHSYREVRERLDCSDEYIREWKKRFQEERLAGLDSRYRGSQPRTRTAEGEARILEATRRGPADGTTHWSSYRLAKKLGISQSSVSRVWRHFGIQPHRSRGYMASEDPEFEEKAADIIGLYMKPPLNAAVFCVDEKSAIQALDRLDPVLPLSPGRAERHGFEYFRHGTLSLYAALDTRTGDVIGKTTDRHTSVEFVDFLSTIVASQPAGREIHIVVDNLSAHKTKAVLEFLNTNPAVRLHYTPTYSSWLNQVESGFPKFNVLSLLEESSPPKRTCPESSFVTSSSTTKPPHPSIGDIRMLTTELNPITQRVSDLVH